MLNALVTHFPTMLTNFIEKEPGIIVGPISTFLGFILNFLFNIVYAFTTTNSMGLAIILLTIVARSLMLPMAFAQQKSMVAMRKLQPQMEKIKAKYGGSKEPEQQQKMNAEIQALYAKNKVNPLSGCLPMLITLPIFFALNSLMRNSYLHVTVLGQVYDGISQVLVDNMSSVFNVLKPIVASKVQDGSGIVLDFDRVADMSRALSSFRPDDWTALLSGIQSVSVGAYDQILTLFTQKQQIENFLSIDLIAATGWAFPGIIIPILTGATTFLSTWILNKQQAATADSAMKSQQTIMLIVMPIMMTWMTTSLSAGVGIYWITSSVYQTVQQVLLNRYYTRDGAVLIAGAEAKQPKEIITLDKSRNKKKGEKS